MPGDRFDAVVVGAGIVGLTTAVRLRAAGARVAVVTADAPARTVSRIAAAVWYPTRTAGDARVLDWARRTYDEFADQAARCVPGVVMRPTRMLLRAPAGPPWWEDAVRDFRSTGPPDQPGPFTGQWRFTAPTVEMGPYLDWLVVRLTDAGVVMFRRRLAGLVDAAELAPVVLNATGLAARELAPDPAVHAVRGRVILVANPGLHVSMRDEDNPDGPTYVHPRSHDVVLGGTFEPGEEDTSPDASAGRAILDRATALVPRLAGVRVIGEQTGLRPGRHGGARVEPDPVAFGGGTRLIHNYGHGGAGVTLSWGCADHLVKLVGG